MRLFGWFSTTVTSSQSLSGSWEKEILLADERFFFLKRKLSERLLCWNANYCHTTTTVVCIHAYYSWWPFSLSAYPFCCFSQENGREVLKFLGLNVTQILTAFMATLHFEVLACIDFWSRKEGKKVDDEGSPPPPPRGCKINETGMSGFTVCLVTNETGISRTHTSDLVEKKPRNRWAHCLKINQNVAFVLTTFWLIKTSLSGNTVWTLVNVARFARHVEWVGLGPAFLIHSS